MDTNDLVKENLEDHGGFVRMEKSTKVSILGEMIDNHKNDQFASRVG